MNVADPFTTTDEIIGSAITGLERYPSLHRLLEDKMKSEKFSRKANSLGIDQLCKGPLDIFYMLAMVGGPDNSLDKLYKPILLEIEKTIATLSILKSKKATKSFCKKFLNLDNQETLSAISELSIGSHFHENGYMVEFEIPFITDRSDGLTGKKDVDVRVTHGSKVYLIEVYNPFQALKSPVNRNPRIENQPKCFVSSSQEGVVHKIRVKAEKKFGPNGSWKIEPDGRLILAINLAYSWETVLFQLFEFDQDFEEGLCRALEDISALDGFFTYYSLPEYEMPLRIVRPKLYLRDESFGRFVGHFSTQTTQ